MTRIFARVLPRPWFRCHHCGQRVPWRARHRITAAGCRPSLACAACVQALLSVWES